MVTAVKTTSAVGIHMIVAFVTMYIFTGSIAFGGLAAVIEPICNALIMPLHEKVWERIRRRIQLRQKRNDALAQAAARTA